MGKIYTFIRFRKTKLLEIRIDVHTVKYAVVRIFATLISKCGYGLNYFFTLEVCRSTHFRFGGSGHYFMSYPGV